MDNYNYVENNYVHEQLKNEEIANILDGCRSECLKNFDKKLVEIIFGHKNLKYIINQFLENCGSNILSYNMAELEDWEETFVANFSIKNQNISTSDYESLEDILVIIFFRVLEGLFEKNETEFGDIDIFQQNLNSNENLETSFYFVPKSSEKFSQLGLSFSNFLNILNQNSAQDISSSQIIFQKYYNFLNRIDENIVSDINKKLQIVVKYLDNINIKTNVFRIILFLKNLERTSIDKINKKFVEKNLTEKPGEDFEILEEIFVTKNFDTNIELLIPAIFTDIQKKFEENNFGEKFVVTENISQTLLLLKWVEYNEYTSLTKEEKPIGLNRLKELEKLDNLDQTNKMREVGKNDTHKQLSHILYEFYSQILAENEIWDIEQFMENTNIIFEDGKIILKTIDGMEMKKLPILDKPIIKSDLKKTLQQQIDEFDFPKSDKKFLA